MKHSPNNPANTDFSDFEDLTLFADESFDTDEVDLFEFTGEEDSPLTRLKSIILSLDWEINDDILQELSDEVQHLQESMAGDKIALLYLQGLEKIGRYLRSEGAYSHPNSIKLLLTFFYDFEKIVSSEDLSEDDVTLILKRDVRKFKILQYQISRQLDHGRSREEVEEIRTVEKAVAKGEPVSQVDRLKLLKATILGLDWEVTDDGLRQFQDEVRHYASEMTENPQAMILIKGLLALGGYITEEKSKAHPDAFSMLHSFYSGLEELLIKGEELDEEGCSEIIVDRVGRLNSLKAAIAARKMSATPGQMVEDVVDEIVEPSDMELDEDFLTEETEAPAVADAVPEAVEELPAMPAAAPALAGEAEEEEPAGGDFGAELASELDSFFDLDEEAVAVTSAGADLPDEELDPSAITPVSDEVADALIEEQLSSRRSLKPALFDADEEEEAVSTRWDEGLEDADAQEDLEGQLSILFDGMDEEEEGEKTVPAAESAEAEEEGPLAALAEVAEESPAVLSQDEEDARPIAAIGSEEEIDDQLDMLFGDEEEAPAVVAAAEPEEEEAEIDTIAPALMDSDEESGFSEDDVVAELQEAPDGEIEAKLDSFFGAALEEEEPGIEEIATADDELEESLDEFFGDEEAEEEAVAPALADFPEETLEPAAELAPAGDELVDEDLEEKLENFFGESDAEAAEAGAEAGEDLFELSLDESLEEALTEEEEAVAEMEKPDLEPVLADSMAEDAEGAEETLFAAEPEAAEDAVELVGDGALAEADLDEFEEPGSLDEFEEMEDLTLAEDIDSLFDEEIEDFDAIESETISAMPPETEEEEAAIEEMAPEAEEAELSASLDNLFGEEESEETAETMVAEEETALGASLDNLFGEEETLAVEPGEATEEEGEALLETGLDTLFAEEEPAPVMSIMEEADEAELEENLDLLFQEEPGVETTEESLFREEMEAAVEEEAPVGREPLDLIPDEEVLAREEESAGDLERLAGLLAGLTERADRERAKECNDLLKDIRSGGTLDPGQKSYSHLLSSMLNLLPLKGQAQDEATGSLFAFLLDRMEQGRIEELPEALDRFTGWQVALINDWAEAAAEAPSGTAVEGKYQELAAEVMRVMSELQDSLKQEIALLK